MNVVVPPPGVESRAPWCPGWIRGGTWDRGDSIDSVQWLDLPACPPLDLAVVERSYFRWPPRLSAGAVWPEFHGDTIIMAHVPFSFPKFIWLGAPRVTPSSRTRPVEGGFLAKAGGEIAFEVLARGDGVRLVVALRGFIPRLPHFLYFMTQRQMHERSTFGFLREVGRWVTPSLRLTRSNQDSLDTSWTNRIP